MVTVIVKIYESDLNTRELSNISKHKVHYGATIEKIIDLINEKYRFDDVTIEKIIFD